eukprot:6173202-Pleurochrysis_carterae.AAC.4
MASPSRGQASELFTSPTTSLRFFMQGQGERRTDGRADGDGGGLRRRPALWLKGVASGLPTRPSPRSGRMHCLAEAMQPPAASRGGRRRWALVAPRATAPNPIS